MKPKRELNTKDEVQFLLVWQDSKFVYMDWTPLTPPVRFDWTGQGQFSRT